MSATEFDRYSRIYDKQIDHEAAQEAALELIGEAMTSYGLEPEHPWYASLPNKATSELIMVIAKKLDSCGTDLGYPVSDQVVWPLHSWLSDALGLVRGTSLETGRGAE